MSGRRNLKLNLIDEAVNEMHLHAFEVEDAGRSLIPQVRLLAYRLAQRMTIAELEDFIEVCERRREAGAGKQRVYVPANMGSAHPPKEGDT